MARRSPGSAALHCCSHLAFPGEHTRLACGLRRLAANSSSHFACGASCAESPQTIKTPLDASPHQARNADRRKPTAQAVGIALHNSKEPRSGEQFRPLSLTPRFSGVLSGITISLTASAVSSARHSMPQRSKISPKKVPKST